jgi:hypothetical protein
MTALKCYPVQTSPADCPSSKGYGDSSESTRSEKSGSKDWNLHGLRGTEAIQVSSHRGPPTDRPPDKPPPKVGVFAGCSQERANTLRIRRLASLCRSSRCLRGLKSSLAANANYGKSCHHSTFCAHADGSSHEVNRGLSSTPPRYGRFRVNGIRLRASCRPSSNLGRNLFPPRRFSYDTRLSGVNATACQPTPFGS